MSCSGTMALYWLKVREDSAETPKTVALFVGTGTKTMSRPSNRLFQARIGNCLFERSRKKLPDTEKNRVSQEAYRARIIGSQVPQT